MVLELPHTAGCLVCGRDNAHGLKLSLEVSPETGVVRAGFTPREEHIGFEGIVHGGLLATVLDEAMVWAASWRGKRFCVCGELCVRFRQSAEVGQALSVTAQVVARRAGLVQTQGSVRTDTGMLVASATGKYVPVDPGRDRAFKASFVPSPATRQAAEALLRGE